MVRLCSEGVWQNYFKRVLIDKIAFFYNHMVKENLHPNCLWVHSILNPLELFLYIFTICWWILHSYSKKLLFVLLRNFNELLKKFLKIAWESGFRKKMTENRIFKEMYLLINNLRIVKQIPERWCIKSPKTYLCTFSERQNVRNWLIMICGFINLLLDELS